MKVNKKRNHLEEEGEKIEEIPEEKNSGEDGQDKPTNAKKPRKNRFLARLRKSWARFTGFMRRCICIQGEGSSEELPAPSSINMEDSKANVSFEEEKKEDNVEDNQSIKADDDEVKLEIIEEYHDLIQSLEDLHIEDGEQQRAEVDMENKIDDGVNIKKDGGSNGSSFTDNFSFKEKEKEEYNVKENQSTKVDDKQAKWENLEYHDLIQKLEDLHIQDKVDGEQCNAEEEQQSKIHDQYLNDYHDLIQKLEGLSIQDKMDGEQRNAEEELQNKDEEEYYSSEESSSTGSSLELEIPVWLYKTAKTIQSGSSDSKSDHSSQELETPEEEADQSCEERSATVPLLLESFTFHRMLGAGGFGKVYMARDLIRKECVAIKASPKRNLTWTRSNYIERHILKLSHESPYLIHGLAAFHTLNHVYFVMEPATGGNLDHFLFNHFPLDTPTIKFIIAELICGIEFLHKKYIIHRDLKPENILLTADGHVKITDFGISVVVGGDKKTKFRCRGTPGHAAPEMVKDKEHGPGVDYFGIGVILYKLCTGTKPFPGHRISEIQHAVVHQTPRYPRSLNRVTLNILKGLLHKNQFKRLGVKRDIRKDLFFDGINWEDVEARRVAPPAIMIANSVDLNINRTLDYTERPNSRITVDQKIFNRFSFVCPEWSQHYHPIIIESKS